MSRLKLETNRDLGRIARAGSAIVLITVLAIAAPLITSNDPTVMHIADRFASPTWSHPLGSDALGHDILAQLLYGARTSLAVAFSSAVLSAIFGIALGLLGGYFGGLAESAALRLTDVVLSFPPILLALLVVTFVGPGAVTLAVVLAVLSAPNFVRITYAEVLTVRRLEYVEAVVALGATSSRVMLRTVLPNIFPPLLVQFSLTVSSVILLESGLSFLGLGVTPPTPSWGLMVQSARATMTTQPLNLLWPCVALALTVFAVNHLCDVIQEIYDPRERHSKQGEKKLAAVKLDVRRQATLVDRSVSSQAALRIQNLDIAVPASNGERIAVNDVSISIGKGETVALVGESGSGKSLTSLAALGLLTSGVRVANGQIMFPKSEATGASENIDILKLSDAGIRKLRGNDLAMVFQEPMTSLNPVYRIGDQITESILTHQSVSRRQAREAALAMLTKVGITDPKRRLDQFPHELSGGMRQRVMIALALCCEPALLVADEPTTALDVTLQAEILALLKKQQNDRHGTMSVLFITHNLGVVAQVADRVVVLYAGRVVEEGPTVEIFASPKHPYTKGLLACVPDSRNRTRTSTGERVRLKAIPGSVPIALPDGCTFSPRCDMATDACRSREPVLETAGVEGHFSRCIRWREC
ncbi:dipeptide/oligopeptide/nickel ABC transporter permease/ATP-binding protein [Paraburkholderia sp. J8-2]|uniref:dipeptide/oligopeptide/nickel ABC transporter permease/ATP-binding protein n=1 Tax=Paraburkholderia sp. J8-2 TaxID=2805440 RepID=UPI002AB7634D|nr:dipeptide/oligopeptide/nickel ABC transporter permease/ATP-binding protein [Paraburkholderia sp. J8-2]